MEDGALAHYAVLMRKWLQERGFKRFEGCPGKFPDLNLVENLWSQVKHAQCHVHATSIAGQKKNRPTGLKTGHPQFIQTLYKSMPRGITAVVQAQGSHTKY